MENPEKLATPGKQNTETKKKWTTLTPQKTGGETRCSSRISTDYSTNKYASIFIILVSIELKYWYIVCE
jgi:hypothetical protein